MKKENRGSTRSVDSEEEQDVVSELRVGDSLFKSTCVSSIHRASFLKHKRKRKKSV